MQVPENPEIIGKPLRRREDQRLLTGKGRFTDDLGLPRQVYAVIVRSPFSHAVVRSIDTSDALEVPGVLAVYTYADLQAEGIKSLAPDFAFLPPIELQRQLPDVVLVNKDDTPIFESPWPLLAADRVRFVGQAVAMVVAESIAQAKDGAEAVLVDYDALPAVTHTAQAAKPGAPKLWDHAPSNVCLDAEHGDRTATDTAFGKAAHVVHLETWIQRVTGVPLEARAALAEYDTASERYTMYAGTGGSHRQQREIAGILGVEQQSVRVVAYDIGGNFGTKNPLYPEYPLVCWAAKKLGRPVKWTCERSEAFLSDYQGRDMHIDAELALDAQGRFLAYRGTVISNLGAHAASIIPLRKVISIANTVYRVPVSHFRAMGVLSNTASTAPYRSSGRPEAMFVMERLIELAARKSGIEANELRRINAVRGTEQPYRNPSGVVYDSGDYALAMETCLAQADWNSFASRRDEARRRGKLRGIGFANYIELTTGFPREWAGITVDADAGELELAIGTLSSGQGHETSFPQVVSEWLGVPAEKIRFVQGDTDRVASGGGSHSGRSLRLGSVVMGRAAEQIIEKGRRIAAGMLETAEIDIEFVKGRFNVKGTDRSVGLFDVARQEPLAAQHEEFFKIGGFPFGCQVCEVEIDPETGEIAMVRHTAVDDVGRAINPMIIDGQTHGGIVQGMGQAMQEHCHYDAESGQLLAGSFMDYALPRADQFPHFDTTIMETPTPVNPLGARAGSEGGTTPALAVYINAVVDALKDHGVTHMELPATPDKVWRAIHRRDLDRKDFQ